VFWVSNPCTFYVNAGVSEKYTVANACPEDGGGMFISNDGVHLRTYTVSKPGRTLSSSPRREYRNSPEQSVHYRLAVV
jgi:hypothetical protein